MADRKARFFRHLAVDASRSSSGLVSISRKVFHVVGSRAAVPRCRHPTGRTDPEAGRPIPGLRSGHGRATRPPSISNSRRRASRPFSHDGPVEPLEGSPQARRMAVVPGLLLRPRGPGGRASRAVLRRGRRPRRDRRASGPHRGTGNRQHPDAGRDRFAVRIPARSSARAIWWRSSGARCGAWWGAWCGRARVRGSCCPLD